MTVFRYVYLFFHDSIHKITHFPSLSDKTIVVLSPYDLCDGGTLNLEFTHIHCGMALEQARQLSLSSTVSGKQVITCPNSSSEQNDMGLYCLFKQQGCLNEGTQHIFAIFPPDH